MKHRQVLCTRTSQHALAVPFPPLLSRQFWFLTRTPIRPAQLASLLLLFPPQLTLSRAAGISKQVLSATCLKPPSVPHHHENQIQAPFARLIRTSLVYLTLHSLSSVSLWFQPHGHLPLPPNALGISFPRFPPTGMRLTWIILYSLLRQALLASQSKVSASLATFLYHITILFFSIPLYLFQSQIILILLGFLSCT